MSATVAVMHNDVDCSNEESVSATLKQNMNNLQCVENNTCTVSTSTYGCGSSRQRSNETSLHTSIQIISLQLEKPLNLEELYSNNIGLFVIPYSFYEQAFGFPLINNY